MRMPAHPSLLQEPEDGVDVAEKVGAAQNASPFPRLKQAEKKRG